MTCFKIILLVGSAVAVLSHPHGHLHSVPKQQSSYGEAAHEVHHIVHPTQSHYHDDHEHKESSLPYHFSYGVHDSHSKDVKSHQEESDGHTIKGSYTIEEADGTKRVVEYTADKHNGFQAVVKKIGHAKHSPQIIHKKQEEILDLDHLQKVIRYEHHQQHHPEVVHYNHHHKEIAHHHEGHHEHQEHKQTPYVFSYGVHDPHSKDVKSHVEESDGKVTKGSYSVEEADGTKRVVEYTADNHNGFQAVVKKIGHAYHPEPKVHKGHHHEEIIELVRPVQYPQHEKHWGY